MGPIKMMWLLILFLVKIQISISLVLQMAISMVSAIWVLRMDLLLV
ncbi:hypothetical protein KR49_00080 [Synechococcus sp. KORDI-49]|nr:hypothetical protein KR49_00080 [Synechococcus sp. KORDI-49]